MSICSAFWSSFTQRTRSPFEGFFDKCSFADHTACVSYKTSHTIIITTKLQCMYQLNNLNTNTIEYTKKIPNAKQAPLKLTRRKCAQSQRKCIDVDGMCAVRSVAKACQSCSCSLEISRKLTAESLRDSLPTASNTVQWSCQ